jgi:transposase-like protein
MKKSARSAAKRKARKAEESQRQQHVVEVARMLVSAGYTLRQMVLNVGFEVLTRLLEEDREQLCGPRKKKQTDRSAYRYGYDQGQLVLGGRKVSLPKPRVRGVEGGEVPLPTWQQMAEEDPLDSRVLEQILVGVSTRNYHRSLEPMPESTPSVGVSRASVSRRFVARTTAQVKSFLSSSLADVDLPVVMIDGTQMGDHLLLVALGIEASGTKHVLGVVEGSAESEAVARQLLRNLLDRGLVVERARLFVIDGSRGIRKAIRQVFGHWALIQRCQVHKLKNVLEHLPEAKRAWVRAAIRKAWDQATAKKAKSKLLRLAAQLKEPHPGAAASLREGLEETLMLIELGVQGALYRTLRSTNPIENLNGTLKRVARNVKRWRSGSMAIRWVVTGLLEAKKRFRRVKGYRDMPQLLAALEAQIEEPALDKDEKAA